LFPGRVEVDQWEGQWSLYISFDASGIDDVDRHLEILTGCMDGFVELTHAPIEKVVVLGTELSQEDE
jgi:hypothetical protein